MADSVVQIVLFHPHVEVVVQVHVDLDVDSLVHRAQSSARFIVQDRVPRNVILLVKMDVERDVLLNQLQLTLQLTELKLARIPQHCQVLLIMDLLQVHPVHLMVLDIHIPLRQLEL